MPVGFYSLWAPEANPPLFSAGLGTVHGGVSLSIHQYANYVIVQLNKVVVCRILKSIV